MKTTYNKLIKIQNEQLANWANVLKQEVQAALVVHVRKNTLTAVALHIHPDAEVELDEVMQSAVPRGSYMDGIIGNWAMTPSTCPALTP